MTTPEQVLELVERFERNREAYLSGAYNETQVRREFIDPFFEALGWDVDNRQGWAEAYKDVIHEDAIRVSGKDGGPAAPDYCFRIGGARKFFVEAKKPAVKVREDVAPAYQLRRYAWSAKLPLSILTDFEELAVYDCRQKPAHTDKASMGRVLYWTYRDYAEKWDEIAGIFSRDAILKGSFDKYVESSKAKRGTAEVDSAFLKEIESWRDALARSIALRNASLTQRELNYAVQVTLDRIIFLRICEDRGIEDYARLMAETNGPGIYARLVELFRLADARYNSGLFHFQNEKGQAEEPDRLTPRLSIDDKALKDIIKDLYYPDSPYEFSVLGADILGQVYEQFLGKVIRLTSGHRAVVEDKPEVKKAGGVYYTPTYVVDYIVEHTVGKLLEGKTPKQVQKLRILDPACGSGSFLIGAFQYLLDWHLKWYLDDGAAKHEGKELYRRAENDWRLATAQKKQILLKNIYGVDIDLQAVEVTKLSLLLKVLEGETEETIATQMRMFHERALPNLANNIKCGNSLIGADFYEGQQMMLLDEEERYRVNVFDWAAEFKEIMAAGGFDAVIGNPPYIGFQGFKEDKTYLKLHFKSAVGRFDYYLPFIEKALTVLARGGLLGFICPTNFAKRGYGAALRQMLAREATMMEITDFEDVQVFGRALNYTGVFIIRAAAPAFDHSFPYRQRSLANEAFSVSQRSLGSEPWVFRDRQASQLVERLAAGPVSPLGDLAAGISEGIVTGHNGVFLVPAHQARQMGLEVDLIRPCLRGREIHRYWHQASNEFVIYPYRLVAERAAVMAEVDMRRHPRVWKYLEGRRVEVSGRDYFDSSGKAWYELWCQRDLRLLARQKIVVPELAPSSRFAMASADIFYGDTVCGITLLPSVNEDLRYVLGILNSRLMDYFYAQTTVPKANGFHIYKTMYLRNVPIRRVDFSSSEDAARHDDLVQLVDRALMLASQAASARTSHDKATVLRQASLVDRQIEEVVYELYGLTTEDVALVESAAAPAPS